MEVDTCEIRGPVCGLPVLLQDPEEDVADYAHIGDAVPGSKGGVGTRGRLREEEQLLLVQPDGVYEGKDLLTGTRVLPSETDRTSGFSFAALFLPKCITAYWLFLKFFF